MRARCLLLALACLLPAPADAEESYGTSADKFMEVCASLCGSPPTRESIAGFMEENRMRPSVMGGWEQADSIGVTRVLLTGDLKMAVFVFTPKRQTALPSAILTTLLDSRGRVDFTVYPGEINIELPPDTTRFGQGNCSTIDTIVLRMQDGAWLRTHRMLRW